MTPHDLVLTRCGLRFEGRTYPCSIGKSGLTDCKTEGDGATPVGMHRIVGMLYRPDRISPPTRWARAIRPGDLWSDDPQAPDYNKQTKAPYSHSHETLRRADPLYDLVLITDWNWQDPQPGRGSAIFIHQWRRPGYPTEGCIALPRAALHAIARRVTQHSLLLIPS